MSKIPRIGSQGFVSHHGTQAPEGRRKLAAAVRRPCRGFCICAVLIPRAHARG